MTATELVPVVAAYTVCVRAPKGGFMLGLLALADGRVVVLNLWGSPLAYPSMQAIGEECRSRGWSIGELIPDAETLERYADGYEIGGSDGTR